MTLLASAQPTASADGVAILGENLAQVFALCKIIKISVSEESKVMEHPLENGATTVDHAVALPVTIEVSTVTARGQYVDAYQQVKQAYLQRQLFSVQTRTGLYSSMLIESMPHEEDPEQFDVVPIAIRFREVYIVQPQYGTLPPRKVANPANASTVDRGEQRPKESARGASVLYGIFN